MKKVEHLMTRDVKIFSPDDALNRAAQIMWESDIGVVPVVDAEGGVVGMITDRDLCMAAYSRGLPLASLRVRDAMSCDVFSCSPGDSLESAMALMRRWHVRRLPVLDRWRYPVGILSLNDLAREADRKDLEGPAMMSASNLVRTFATIGQPWREIPPQVVLKPVAKRDKPQGATDVARPVDSVR